MKKRILSLLLTLTLLICLVPASAVAATDVTSYDLYICGQQVTSENLSGDGWIFRPSEDPEDPYGSLELTNANLTATGDDGIVIRSGIPLFIDLSGTNTLTGSTYGISSTDRITFMAKENSMTLQVSGDSTGIQAGQLTFWNGGTYRISGGIVGLQVGQTFTLDGGDKITVEGGTHGIMVGSADNRADFNISAYATIKATGSSGNGIFVPNGNLTISAAAVEVTSETSAAVNVSGKLTVNKSDMVTARGNTDGISAGSLEIGNSTLTAVGTNGSGLAINGEASLNGNAIIATGATSAIRAQAITLGEDTAVKSPENGAVSSDTTTIVDADSVTARSAEIMRLFSVNARYGEIENGQVTLDKEKYYPGDTVTLTLVPDDSLVLSSIFAIGDESNQAISFTKVKGKPQYTFTMPAEDVVYDIKFGPAHTYTLDFGEKHETVAAAFAEATDSELDENEKYQVRVTVGADVEHDAGEPYNALEDLLRNNLTGGMIDEGELLDYEYRVGVHPMSLYVDQDEYSRETGSGGYNTEVTTYYVFWKAPVSDPTITVNSVPKCGDTIEFRTINTYGPFTYPRPDISVSSGLSLQDYQIFHTEWWIEGHNANNPEVILQGDSSYQIHGYLDVAWNKYIPDDMADILTVDGGSLVSFPRDSVHEFYISVTIKHKPKELLSTKDPTCTEPGVNTYVCEGCNEEYSVPIDATGHDWGAPEYTWNDDNSKVTASRTCSKTPAHDGSVETETVDTTSAITKTATPEEDGEITYTATFKNDAFAVQTKTVAVPMTGYTVTVTSAGNGTASADVTGGNKGTNVTLTAVADTGYRFAEWKVVAGNVTITDDSFTIGSADVEIQAIFEEIPPILYSVNVANDGNGSASADVTSGKEGTAVTLTVNPNSGYELDKIALIPINGKVADITEAGNFSIPASDVVVYVTFKEILVVPAAEYTVTVAGDNNGTTSADVTSGKEGTKVTISASPKSGYELDKIVCIPIGGSISDITSSKTFTIPAADVAVYVTFKEIQVVPAAVYTVTVASDGNGTVSADVSSGKEGTKVTISVSPKSGYELDRIVSIPNGGTLSDITSSRSLTIPAANVTVYATFREVPPAVYTVTFVTNGGSAVDAVQVTAGNTVRKPSDPTKNGYSFAGWYKDSTMKTTWDFTSPITSDTYIYAKWMTIPTPEKAYYYDLDGGIVPVLTKGSISSIVKTFKRSIQDETCIEHFTGVMVDGTKWTRGTDYTAVGGSTVITLNASALEKLSIGTHTVSIIFDDGQIDFSLVVKTEVSPDSSAPKTSDFTTPLLWIAVFLVSGICILCVIFLRPKQRKKVKK